MPTASAQTLTRQYCYGTIFLFGLVTVGALIGLPTYAYCLDYTWVDWAMFGLLYVMTGLGITVGYHRLLAHRSFDCPNWVKGCLLVAGGWALEIFFFSSRRRHTRLQGDWSSDVCSSD